MVVDALSMKKQSWKLNGVDLARKENGKNHINMTNKNQVTIQKVKTLLGTENYPKFVSKLGRLAKDPKVMRLLGSGLFDGKVKDESFRMEIKDIPVMSKIGKFYKSNPFEINIILSYIG